MIITSENHPPNPTRRSIRLFCFFFLTIRQPAEGLPRFETRRHAARNVTGRRYEIIITSEVQHRRVRTRCIERKIDTYSRLLVIIIMIIIINVPIYYIIWYEYTCNIHMRRGAVVDVINFTAAVAAAVYNHHTVIKFSTFQTVKKVKTLSSKPKVGEQKVSSGNRACDLYTVYYTVIERYCGCVFCM